MSCKIIPGCQVDPPCKVQLEPTSTTLPSAICTHMVRKTVKQFAIDHFMGGPRDVAEYTYTWPLPIGSRSIDGWRKRYLARTGEESHSTISPQIENVDALLGLVIKRVVVHEQGTGENHCEDDCGTILPSVAECFEKRLERRRRLTARFTHKRGCENNRCQDDASITATPSVFESSYRCTRYSSVTLLGLVEEVGRAPDGLRQYRFCKPRILVDSQAKKTSEAGEVSKQERELTDWYNTHLLGKKRRGRPIGTTETFENREDFRQSVRKAIGIVRRKGQRVTAENVAESLDGPNIGRRILHKRSEDPARQLRRDRHRAGYDSFEELVSDLDTG